MPDHLNDVGPQDGKFISLTQSWEVSYWKKALGITEEQLREAVDAVGPSAARVREYLAEADDAEPLDD